MTYLQLLRPRFWIRNGLTNWKHNTWLKNYLKTNPKIDLEKSGCHTVVFEDGIELWISNFPYSFGYIYNRINGGDKLLPSRCTCIKLWNYLTKNGMIVSKNEIEQERKTRNYLNELKADLEKEWK